MDIETAKIGLGAVVKQARTTAQRLAKKMYPREGRKMLSKRVEINQSIYTGWGNCKRVREVEASNCLGAARMSGKVARWSTASDDIGTLRLISVRVFSSSVSVDGARRRCS
jgi:hypothetical protein